VAKEVGIGSGQTYSRHKKVLEQVEQEAPELMPFIIRWCQPHRSPLDATLWPDDNKVEPKQYERTTDYQVAKSVGLGSGPTYRRHKKIIAQREGVGPALRRAHIHPAPAPPNPTQLVRGLLHARHRGGGPGALGKAGGDGLVDEPPDVANGAPLLSQIVLHPRLERRNLSLSSPALLILAGRSLLSLRAVVALVLLLDLCLDRGGLIANRLPAHLQLDVGERPRWLKSSLVPWHS